LVGALTAGIVDVVDAVRNGDAADVITQSSGIIGGLVRGALTGLAATWYFGPGAVVGVIAGGIVGSLAGELTVETTVGFIGEALFDRPGIRDTTIWYDNGDGTITESHFSSDTSVFVGGERVETYRVDTVIRGAESGRRVESSVERHLSLRPGQSARDYFENLEEHYRENESEYVGVGRYTADGHRSTRSLNPVDPILFDLDGNGLSITELAQSSQIVDGGGGLIHRTPGL